ncbi:DUF1552 domain-containing protein [Akkermansiaceae bacterium]|nr:DUF1552 domain-containing protein [Akkermansiaceae bacterium]
MNNYTRRRFLAKSVGSAAALILPQFQSLARAQVATGGIPTRLVYMSMGFGVSPSWFPTSSRTGDLSLTDLLKPMAAHKNDISIIQNLSLQGPPTKRVPAHSAGVHLLNDAAAIDPKYSMSASIPTCDQVAADYIGKDTRFPSLVIAASDTDKVKSGNGPGMRSISWNKEGRHMSGIEGAFKLYTALYGDKSVSKGKLTNQFAQKRSVLDFLVRDIKSLNAKLSVGDQQVLDQYTSSLRDVETNLARNFKLSTEKSTLQELEKPEAELEGVEDIKLTYDLMALAMEADYTRVISYMLPVGSILRSMNIQVTAHDMSHYKGAAVAAHHARDEMNMEMLAYFFDRLKTIKQADGNSLFHHSMITFASGLRHKHTRENLPILFAGYGGGGIKQGQNVVNAKNTPINNLWFSKLRHINPQLDNWHNSQNNVSEVFTA